MKKSQIKVVIGGTFEELHAGHMKLISEAFKIGDEVIIGLTSDEFAYKTRRRKVLPYEIRRENLERLISFSHWSKKYHIIKIKDPYGPAVEKEDLDVIVVSIETVSGAMKINQQRLRRNMKPLLIHIINLVETNTGEKISSSNIKRNIVDAWGRPSS